MFMKCWDNETIVNHIQDLYNKKIPVYSSYIHKNYPTLHRAAFRYFGNWEAAIMAAGLNYDEICRYKRWNRKTIITKIKELRKQGVDLSWRQFSLGEHSAVAYAAISKRHFGSWDAALEAAGVSAAEIRRYNRWTRKRIQKQIRDYHNNGKPLAAKHMQQDEPGLYHAACRQFGSWREAIESVGIDYTDIAYRIQRSKEEITNILGDLIAQGISLSDTNMRRHYPAVHASAVRYFGNWSSARKEVGIDRDYRRRSDKEKAETREKANAKKRAKRAKANPKTTDTKAAKPLSTKRTTTKGKSTKSKTKASSASGKSAKKSG